MNGKEAFDKIFDKLTYDQQQELGEQVLRIVYQDLNRLEKLEKENQELRKSIKSWNENGGNLLKENRKLKNIIEILKDIFEIECVYEEDNWYAIDCLNTFYRIKNKEQYELLKEVLEND